MKKGFTLIELLAVIVILAIIALIATPVILNLIEDSRKESDEITISNYLDAMTQAVARENLKASFSPDTCNVNKKILSCSGKDITIDIDSKVSVSGTVVFEKGKITDYDLEINGESFKTKTDSSCFVSIIQGEINKYVCDDTNLVIPANLELPVVEIETVTFNSDRCKNVEEYLKNVDSAKSCESVQADIEKIPLEDISTIFETYYGFFVDITYKETDNIYPINKIGDASFAFKNLNSVSISSAIKTIGFGSFAANLISEVKLEEGVEIIEEYAFFENRLRELVLPNSVEEIKFATFVDNKLSGELIIPASLKTIGDSSFFGKYDGSTNQITSLKFESGSNLETIGSYAFHGNNIGGELILPDSLKEIYEDAFYDNNITSLKLGSNLTYLGHASFCVNNNLQTINIGMTQEEFETIVTIGSDNDGNQYWYCNSLNLNFKQ